MMFWLVCEHTNQIPSSANSSFHGGHLHSTIVVATSAFCPGIGQVHLLAVRSPPEVWQPSFPVLESSSSALLHRILNVDLPCLLSLDVAFCQWTCCNCCSMGIFFAHVVANFFAHVVAITPTVILAHTGTSNNLYIRLDNTQSDSGLPFLFSMHF